MDLAISNSPANLFCDKLPIPFFFTPLPFTGKEDSLNDSGSQPVKRMPLVIKFMKSKADRKGFGSGIVLLIILLSVGSRAMGQ